MAKKRKAAADVQQPAEDGIDAVSCERRAAGARLEQGISCAINLDALDVDHLLKTIRVILLLNKEIWERCQAGRVGKLFFERAFFDEIKVRSEWLKTGG